MFDTNFDPYVVLGVDYAATIDQIHAKYRQAAMRCHPDMGGSHEQMIEVIRAWEILSDPAMKDLCDRARAASNHARTQQQWRKASAAAAATATATVQSHGQTWEEFKTWLDAASADIQSTSRGRIAAATAAGMLVGGVLGIIAGTLTGIGSGAGAVVGLATGAIGGWIAVMGRMSKPAATAQQRSGG